MTRAAEPEPAIKSYFFGKGYRDLGATIAESWKRNLASSAEHFDKIGKLSGETSDKALAILYGTAGIAVVIFGTVVFLATSAVHITILFAFFLLIYVGFSLVYLTEKGYLAWKRFSTVCPECHSKNPLPEFFCPGCGEIHRRLIPSKYGILRHTCLCGQKLPATFFLDRGKLPSRCPDCESLLAAGHTESRKVFVAIFGGPSVGKSAFLFAAVEQLIEHNVQGALDSSFLDPRTAGELERVRQLLGQGQPPAKTLETLPRAFNLQIRAAGKDPRVLYLYDPAGETFNATESLVLHNYQSYLSGLIILIDPFSIEKVRKDYVEQLSLASDSLKPGRVPFGEVLDRILIGMEENFGLSRGARFKVPVALVINKTDAFGLEEKIGASHGDPVREWLRRQEPALVHQLDTRCDQLRYFACSALGRMPDGTAQPFAARGVLEPMLWILGAADSLFGAETNAAAA